MARAQKLSSLWYLRPETCKGLIKLCPFHGNAELVRKTTTGDLLANLMINMSEALSGAGKCFDAHPICGDV